MKIERNPDLTKVRITGGNKKLLYAILVLVIVLIGIMIAINVIKTKHSSQDKNKDNNQEKGTQIANPASVYCEDNGGVLEIKTSSDGSQYGLCISKLNNSISCDEWAFYRGNCSIK
jgi:putative hemolysin